MASVHAAIRGLSTMHSAWHLALSVALLSSLPTAAAHAAEPPDSGTEQKAKHHFHVAQTFKELGEYEKAAEEFLKAYKLYKDPAFFFNAGEMYRLAGNHKLAVKYFKLYLVEHPNGRVAAAAKSTVRELQPKADLQIAKEKLASEVARRKAEEQSAAAAKARREGESAGEAKARQKAEAAAAIAKAEQAVKEAAAAKERYEAEMAAAAKEKQEAEAAERERQKAAATRPPAQAAAELSTKADGSWSVEKRLKVAGIATGAVGVAAIGVGAYFGFSAVSDNSKLETLKNEQKFNPNLIDDRDASETTFYVLTGVGAGALIGGAVLYYLGEGKSGDPEARAAFSVTPVVTPSGASISCIGSF